MRYRLTGHKVRAFPITPKLTLSGENPSSRVYRSYTIPGSLFSENLWREPSPFDFSGEYGLALTQTAGGVWLSSPDSVWQAVLMEQTLDLTDEVISAQCENHTHGGKLTVELSNAEGKFKTPGAGSIGVLDIGCELAFSPGYRTPAGQEVSPGMVFQLERYEHRRGDGKASLVLYAVDGRQMLLNWHARQQFRWNAETAEIPVQSLLQFVLARAGLKLQVISASDTMADYCPDFTIHRGDDGISIIDRLLTFVPDVIFIEGFTVYLLNPQPGDNATYAYGNKHTVLKGQYRTGARETNRVQVTGYAPVSGENIIADGFDWGQIEIMGERPYEMIDRNLSTALQVVARGQAVLRKTEIFSDAGEIAVPVNCAQQLYDVVEISDASAGLTVSKRRILGISLMYRPEKREYLQKMDLGKV